MMRKVIIAAAAATLACHAPLAAQPRAAEPAPTAKVAIADLDLTSAAGQKLLGYRMARAVEAVCGSYANAVEQSDQDRVADCRRTARADADRQIAARRSEIQLAGMRR